MKTALAKESTTIIVGIGFSITVVLLCPSLIVQDVNGQQQQLSADAIFKKVYRWDNNT